MLSRHYVRLLTCGFMLVGTAGLLPPADAQSAPLDANIVTNYTALPTSINWATIGQISYSQYGSLGSFNKACAIVEGTPSTSGDVMTRSVYVLDAGTGTPNNVVLNVFTKTDTIVTSNGATTDTVSIVLNQQVTLALTSQAGVTCYMAANDTSVFVGTSANDSAAIVNKTTFAQSSVASTVTLYNQPVTQITATDAGFVYVTFGSGTNAGFAEYDDQTNYLATGQFYNFTILANTVNATTF